MSEPPIQGNLAGIMAGDKARLRLTIRDLQRDGLSAEEIRSEVFAELDVSYGKLCSVVHVAGRPSFDAGQWCSRCGVLLAYRNEPTWPDGAEVWEVRRWGEPTNPRAMGVVDPARRDPDETECVGPEQGP